ncbi:MAG TPA: beta-L-arabinofuranosidase domain-containing protein [Vicinamibacterales bacterium]|nr:beta-L-arabinofuranosidase domain-containing protein [Vicinamibacterales bacterium]
MSSDAADRDRPDRRDFLKTAGALTSGALMYQSLDAAARTLLEPAAGAAVPATWRVRPFALTQVALGNGMFQQKRDRILNYARNYGNATDIFAGPDRMLRNFRFNAGLDTRGAQPPGSWENATGYLRGHYAGHFMSMLAQAYAGTGDDVYKRKLDYMVAALGECQDALAAAARQPTPRVAGRFDKTLRLSGSPLGHAEHVVLPEGIVSALSDFTIATWINLAVYDRSLLSDSGPNADPAALNNGAAIFDLGNPNAEFGAAPQAHMFLTVRVSNDRAVPRFAITTDGTKGEQQIDGSGPLPVDQWTHIAVTRNGNVGTLYVNGAAVGTNTAMTLRPADLGITKGNWIGRCQFPQRNVSYLNAAVDEFQIFDRALTTADIQSLTNAPGGVVGGGNVLWYRFDESDGPIATDASGRNRDGRIIAPTDGRRHPGFLSAYPETQFIRLEEFAAYGGNQGIWAPYYTLHKILAGLLDAHQLAGNTQALDIAAKIAEWVHSRLAPLPQPQLDRMWNTYIAGEYGGINDSLAQLAALRSGGTDHVVTAKRFINTAVYKPIVANEDILDGRHANQHIPQFIGYLRMFEQNNEPEFHTAAKNFWDMVVPHRVYAHGGVGVGEILRARGVIAGSLYQNPRDNNHAETCPLYNMLKLSRNLFFHDPDPKYMNYYEQGLFNQILGSRRDADSATNPMVTYFVPVRPGQRRSYGNVGTCCGGTGMENHTKYQDSIYFRAADDSALYVNLYIASTLDWPEKRFAIAQATNYPFTGSSTLTVNANGPLDIKLRVPVWVRKGYTVRINGAAQRIEATPGTYVTLSRQWKTGDTIDIAMPFSFRTERALDNPAVQSIFYGPTLLAVQHDVVGKDLETGLINLSFYRHVKLDGDLAPALTPATAPLHFTTGGYTLAPFFVADPASGGGETPATKPYHVYVRRHEPQIVFGSIDSGVLNRSREDRLTLLDVLWDEAPFANHREFTSAVARIAGEWQKAGRLTAQELAAVVDAAGKAERDLRT